MPTRYRRRPRARRPIRRVRRTRRRAIPRGITNINRVFRVVERFQVNSGAAYSYTVNAGQDATVALADLPNSVYSAYQELYQFFRIDAVKWTFLPAYAPGEINQAIANTAAGSASLGPMRVFFVPNTRAMPTITTPEEAYLHAGCKMRVLSARGTSFIVKRPTVAVDLSVGAGSQAIFQNGYVDSSVCVSTPWYSGSWYMQANGNYAGTYIVYVTLYMSLKVAR